MTIELLSVPYDSGHHLLRMGAGPTALVAAGAIRRLRARGFEVRHREVEPISSWRAELRTGFELHRQVAVVAADAHRQGHVPLLLAGNCSATIGILAGLQAGEVAGRRIGLVWFDAHGDFNTPETDTSGFLDGQGLAMAVGRCWQTMTATVPGFTALPEHRVLLIGARALDDAEEAALRASRVTWLPPPFARDAAGVRAAVEQFATEVDLVHVHVDLDVHDPSIAPANSYAATDGLTATEVQDAVRQVATYLPVASAALASYDPSFDIEGRMQETALDLLNLLADVAGTGLRERL